MRSRREYLTNGLYNIYNIKFNIYNMKYYIYYICYMGCIFCFLFLAVTSYRIVWAQAEQKPNGRQQKTESGLPMAEALAAFERGDTERARRLCEETVRTNPKNTTALTILGLIADRTGNLAEAERRFNAVIMLDPDSSSAHNNYGAILLKLGRRREAADQFEASLRLDNRQSNALVNLAQVRAEGGSREELRAARELFERAMSIAPETEIVRALTVIALRLGDRETAARYYKDYSGLLRQQTT